MRLTALVLAITVTGCSFVFVSGPPKQHAQLPAFECSSSRVVPALDTVFAAFLAANFGLAAYYTDQDWNDTYKNEAPFSRQKGLAIYGVLTAVGALGAYYGFTRTTTCIAAKRGLAARPAPAAPSWLPPAIPTPTPDPAPAPAPDPAPEPAPAP